MIMVAHGQSQRELDAGKIKLADANAAVKMRRYVPYWAYISLTGR